MEKQKKSKSTIKKPEYVLQLEKSYGLPSQNAFGSAVFFNRLGPDQSIEEASLAKYKYFVGELWERWGEEVWMSQWKEVYARQEESEHVIVDELLNISDRDASQSVPMILSVVDNADAARLALSKAFDNQDVIALKVYNLGDGEAMSGLLIAGRRDQEMTYLVFLMD
jgi:hypothetical protein